MEPAKANETDMTPGNSEEAKMARQEDTVGTSQDSERLKEQHISGTSQEPHRPTEDNIPGMSQEGERLQQENNHQEDKVNHKSGTSLMSLIAKVQVYLSIRNGMTFCSVQMKISYSW